VFARASFERRLAQDDVEAVPERPLRLRQVELEAGDQPRPRLLVANGLEDRVELEQRIAGEVHLRHEPAGKRAPEDGEVDVSRTPRIRVVLPWVRARLHGDEAVVALVI